MYKTIAKISRVLSKGVLLFLLLFAFNFSKDLSAQDKLDNEFATKRILFIVDASGSMKSEWKGKNKWEVAKRLITKTIDSIEKVDRNVEFAVRLFGHQFPKEEDNCEDTKLEVSFRKYNGVNITNKLNKITPQGHTPIAFSIYSCLNDFPLDPNAKNSIVLVTDGMEDCDGDICALGLQLEQKRITMKPFIIGMGLKEEEKGMFDCIGTYYDAADEKGFSHSLGVVMSQAIHNTTTTVNLIQTNGKPEETNLEMTFYDHYSGVIRHNVLHTMNKEGRPDTLFINPLGKYDLTVHSIPAVEKKNIELIPGRHNIVALDVYLGKILLDWNKPDGKAKAKILVRKTGTDSTLYVMDMRRAQTFRTGMYDLEVLSIPRKNFDSVIVEQSKITSLKLPNPGVLRINVPEAGYASIYKVKDGDYQKVYECYNLKDYEVVQLLPGSYAVVYQRKSNYDSEATVEKRIRIKPLGTASLTF